MDYSKLTKEELFNLCEQRGLTVPKNLAKARIIEVLTESDTAEEVSGAESQSTSQDQGKQKAGRVRLRRKGERKYHNSKNGILTINSDDGGALTETERAEREIIHSKNDNNLILSGKVFSVKPPVRIFLGGRYQLIVFAVAKYKDVKVYIPSNLFLENADAIDEDLLLETMQKRIGSEIDFVTMHIDEEDDSPMKYLASRVTAMRIKRQKFWFGKKYGNGGDIYRINKDDIVEARVTATALKGITVEVFGAETRIPASELAYEYVPDARTKFKQGDRIKVRITSVERDTSAESTNPRTGNFNVRFNASVKQTKDDPRQVYFDEYEIDQTCRGIVTRVDDENGELKFFVNVEGEIDVLCWMKEGVILLPEEGDTVSIRIARKYEENKRFTGTITHVEGTK